MKEIKICGQNNIEFTQEAEKIANYLGFIFFEKSPRNISEKDAKTIILNLKRAKPVGVFVDKKIDEIIKIAKNLNIKIIQLHGEYSKFDAEKLKNLNFSVWKKIHNKNFDILFPCDGFLIDSKPKEIPGGNGEKSDWKLIEKIRSLDKNKKIILAGGLGEKNITCTMTLDVDIFDINSSLEISPGKKSIEKLQKFIKILERINR